MLEIGKERVVPVEDLHPNQWNPNEMDETMFAKELASIKKFGFVAPVVVRWATEGFEIIDGEHRWKAAKYLGINEIPVWDLGVIDDHTAKQLTIVLNETRGQSEPRKLGELLRDLLSRESKESLIETMPFSKDTFEALTGVGRLEIDFAPPSMPKRTPSDLVERVYRMPRSAAETIDQAVYRYRDLSEDPTIPEWKVIVDLCKEFI